MGFRVEGAGLAMALGARRVGVSCSRTPPLRVGPNRRFRDPWFALQVAGFWRAAVQIQVLEKVDVVPLSGLVGV